MAWPRMQVAWPANASGMATHASGMIMRACVHARMHRHTRGDCNWGGGTWPRSSARGMRMCRGHVALAAQQAQCGLKRRRRALQELAAACISNQSGDRGKGVTSRQSCCASGPPEPLGLTRCVVSRKWTQIPDPWERILAA
eukprot:362159-Chlamydomonas_euryale.AAC.11